MQEWVLPGSLKGKEWHMKPMVLGLLLMAALLFLGCSVRVYHDGRRDHSSDERGGAYDRDDHREDRDKGYDSRDDRKGDHDGGGGDSR